MMSFGAFGNCLTVWWRRDLRNPVVSRPNPRLQRTPSASPPSPMSRQPLGGRSL